MKRESKILLVIVFMITFIFNMIVVSAEPGGPSNGSGFGGNMPGGSSSKVSYSGAKEIKNDSTENEGTYSSSTGGENALLVSGGIITVNTPTVTKSGDESSESSDFYGTNAGILVYNGATLNMTGGTVTTNGGHANGVFAYGTGIINITDTIIKTSANNSGGIMVTGGGTLTAKNLNIETEGGSSAAIRSDRGGGTMSIDGGEYTTNGVGSPAIYSTADISVSNANLTATKSEGVVVEGANKVALNKCTLTDTNNTLNGQSETYKNIFLYQSQSGDAAEGTSYFTATDSNIVTNNGDTFYVTNTTAIINLSGNTFTNSSGDFLRIESAAWGSSGSNGGNVTLTFDKQNVVGNILVDNISTLDMIVSNGSMYRGSINNNNSAKNINLTLKKDSIIVLNNDSYISSLSNEIEDNSNIYLNGYNLYVDGNEVSGNNDTPPEVSTVSNDTLDNALISETDSNSYNYIRYIFIGIILILVIIIVIQFIRRRKNRKKD